MINVIVFIQVICLELRGPGSLSIGASNAGPVVGTSKDQHQVNMMKMINTKGNDGFSFQAESDLQGVWGLAEMQMGF